jgi:hypothetical protein
MAEPKTPPEPPRKSKFVLDPTTGDDHAFHEAAIEDDPRWLKELVKKAEEGQKRR